LIVDADHVPLPNFLERTLGYMDDPEVAFVQSPQAFFNRSFQHPRDYEDPVLNEQSLFYDLICRGKDRHNACFWCGSSALVRRSALEAVGGVATETVVEDTHTAMKLHQAGWRSVYHPEVLAVGLAPEEVTAFLTQRGRWAAGCFQVLRRDNPLFARGLTFQQRLHYFSSVSHYVEGPQRLVGLLVPSLVLLTGTVPLAAPAALYLALFLPQLILVPLATWAMARGRYRFADGERFALVRAIAYTKAAGALFRSGRIRFAVTPKGAGDRSVWLAVLKWQLAIALFAVCAAGYQAAAQLLALPGRLSVFAFGVTVVWALLNAGLLGGTVWWAKSVRHRRQSHRFPVRIEAAYRQDETGPPSEPATVRDLNPFGLAMETRDPVPHGSRPVITLLLDTGLLEVSGTVTRMAKGSGDGFEIGVRFDELTQEKQDIIVRWCFRQPFGPDYPLDGDDRQPEPTAQPVAPVRAATRGRPPPDRGAAGVHADEGLSLHLRRLGRSGPSYAAGHEPRVRRSGRPRVPGVHRRRLRRDRRAARSGRRVVPARGRAAVVRRPARRPRRRRRALPGAVPRRARAVRRRGRPGGRRVPRLTRDARPRRRAPAPVTAASSASSGTPPS
jgi:cellulose synthase (UDP-forming)